MPGIKAALVKGCCTSRAPMKDRGRNLRGVVPANTLSKPAGQGLPWPDVTHSSVACGDGLLA
jgi:hypothetical protein